MSEYLSYGSSAAPLDLNPCKCLECEVGSLLTLLTVSMKSNCPVGSCQEFLNKMEFFFSVFQ